MTRPSRRRPAVLATAAVLLALGAGLTGCSGGGGGAGASGDAAASGAGSVTGGAGGAVSSEVRPEVGGAPVADAAVARDASAATGTEAVLPARDVVSTGWIELAADDVARTRAAVLRVVDGLGGSVADERTETDTDGAVLSSHLVLRVPGTAFERAMGELEGTGDLRSSRTRSEDVGTQVVDLAARVRVQRASIGRLTTLLDRAGSLRSVIRLEDELTRRQADLQSLLRQRAYLADQTAMATVTVDVARTGTVPADPHRAGFLGGLARGWDAFTGTLTALATATGAVLPFAGLAAVLAALAVPVLRRRRARRGRGADQSPATS